MFFDSVDVPLIQMEWKFHYQNGQEIVNFLSARGFEDIADIDGKTSLVDVNIARWPNVPSFTFSIKEPGSNLTTPYNEIVF